MATTTAPFTAKYAVVSKSKTGGTGLLDLDLSYGTIKMVGQNIQYVGSAIVDAVFLRPGVTVDFTGAGAGMDKLYLSGAYADYTYEVQTVGKVSKLVLTRTVNDLTEKATVAAGDQLVFANGVLKTEALITYVRAGSTDAAPTLDVTETSSEPKLDAVDAKLAPAITMTGLTKVVDATKAGVTFAQGVQGAAVKVVGTAGVDTVYVKAGTQVVASGVGAGVDKIYFTGTYADYTKTAVGKTLVFQRTINGVVEKVTLANTGDMAIFADGEVATADIAASLRKGSTTVVTLDGASITPTDSDVQYIVFDKTSSTALTSAKPFKLGDNLVFTVKFSKGVDVTGTPKLALDMGGKTVYATYDAAATGASKTDLKFKYTVQSTDLDANGVSVAQGGVATSAIDLNGGAIKLTGTTTSADINQNPAMGDAAAAKVDGVAPDVTKTYTVVENTAADKVKTPSGITLLADEGVTWSDLAGVDAGYFKLEGAKLSFKESANFEKQSSYNVTVKATDAAGNEKTEAVVVNLTDVQEAPVVAAPLADQTFELGAAWKTNKFVIPTGSLKDEDAISAGKLTYTAKLSSGAALPAWLKFDAATQTFSVDSTVTKALPTLKTALTVRVTLTDEGKRSVFDDFKLTFTDLPVVKSLTVTDGDATNGAALGKAGESLTFTIKLSEAVTSTTGLTAVFTVGGKEVTATAAAVATATDTLSFTSAVPALANGGVSLKSLVADASGQIKNATGETLLPVTAGAVADASYVVDTQAPTITATYSLAENTTADTPLKSVSLGASEAVTWSGLTGADASYFTLGAGADAGKLLFNGKANFEAKSSYAVTVTGTDKAGNATQQAVTINLTDVAETNSQPTGAVTVTGTSTQGQTLTASNTLADADGMGAVSYKWQVSTDGSTGWTDISGATASTFTLTQAQVGKHVRVLASYTDGEKTLEAVPSAGTVVANVNDPVTGTVTFTGTAAQGQTLTASNTLADVDGLGTVSYKWEVSDNGGANWTDISGATASTFTLTQAQVGKYVRVTASYTDGFGASESLSSSPTLSTVANVNDAPTGTVTFSGTATQGQVLTAANTLADVDGMGTVSYKWEVSNDGSTGWTAISGATASTFTLAEAQVGKYVRVTASYTDARGTTESLSSSPTAAAVANLNDLPTGSVSLSGTAANGSTLTADTSTLVDLDGLGTFSYKWQTSSAASGQPWTDISGATGGTYSLTSNEIGKYVRAVVSYTDGHGTPEVVNSSVTSNAVTNINTLPTGSVTFTGTATQGQVLTAANTLADTDGLGTISYKWEVSNDGSTGWSAISGATASTFTLAQAQVGKYVRVTASYTDGQGAVEAVSSSPTAAAVANINDAPTGTVTFTGTATQGQVLTAANTLADVDGLGTISYKWEVSADGSTNWTAISGATASTYTLAQAQVGKYVRVTASYTDGFGASESRSSSPTAAAVANLNDLPTGAVSITGAATQGQTLTAGNSLVDADGMGTVSYKWQVSDNGSTNWTDISGATASTLALAQAQVGKYIRVVASYTDALGTPEVVNSNPTAVVSNVNDAPTGTVTFTGTATQGQVLTAANTLADTDGLGTISYKWQVSADGSTNWTDISGATASTYTLAQAQVGKYVRVTASYTDGFGASESRSSSPTAAVANINDAPTGTVTFSGTATQGQVLTAANTLADVDGMGTVSYKWEVSANGTSGWSAISGATASTFTLAEAQVGKYVRVTASYTDGFGASESLSSTPTAAVANLNDLPTGSVSLSGTAANGSTLTADTSTLVDLDGLGSFSYKWQTSSAASGQAWTDISGATSSTFSLTSAQVGKYVRAVVSYTDGHGTAEVVNSSVTSNAVTNINTLPTGSVTFTGTATQGQVLTAANTLADTDGLGTISYKWEVSNDGSTGWSAISGATASTFTLAQAQVGKYVRVTASYTDGQGAVEAVSSSPTAAAVANINDAPTGTVTFTGTATQGQVLTAANTLADVDGLGTISYKWEVSNDGSTGWSAISGATASTFTLLSAQVGKYVRVTASYTDGFGASESLSSTPTAAAVASVPAASITSVTSSKAASTVNTTVDAGAVTYTVTFSNPIKSGTTLSSSNFKVFANDGTTEIGTISSVNKTSDSVWAVAVSFNTGVDQSASTLKFIASGVTDAYDNAMSDHVAQNAGANFTQSVDTAVPTFTVADNSGGVISNLESDASTDGVRLTASSAPADTVKFEVFDKDGNSLGSDANSPWYIDVGNLAAYRAATTLDATTGRGTYAFTAKATDDGGNVTSSVYNLNFDVLAQGATLNAALTAVDDTSFDANGKFTITGLAYESGTVKLEWWKTGSTAADLTSTSSVVNIGTSNAWSVTFNKKALQDLAGSGTFKLVTTDSAGNTVSQDFSATVSPSSGGSMLSSLVTHAVNSLTDAGAGTYTLNKASTNAVWTANAINAFSADGTSAKAFADRGGNGVWGSDYADILVYDAATDTTKLVTHTSAGALDGYTSGASSLSAEQALYRASNSQIATYVGGDTKFVAFTGNAAAFGMGGATNGAFTERNGSVRNTGSILDILVYNVATGVTNLVSHASSSSLDSGYTSSTYLTGSQAMTWDAEGAHNFQQMSGQYLTFTATNARFVGRGGANNASFIERAGPGAATGTTDLYVYDAVSQETKLITHLTAGAGEDTYSGAAGLSAADAMFYATTKATDASVTAMSGRYTAFGASNISDLGAGGATNSGFFERVGTTRDTTAYKDLLVFDAVTGVTKLVSHASTSDLNSGYSTDTYFTANEALTAAAEVQTTFTSMSDQYTVFSINNAGKVGMGGASNGNFKERVGSANYTTVDVTDMMVFDFASGETKLITHAAAGDLVSFWSGETGTLSAADALITGTNRATTFEAQSGQYVTFSANAITGIGSGGVANLGFKERPGSTSTTSIKDLMVFDAVSGETKLVTHVAAGSPETLYSGAAALSASDAMSYGTYLASDATFAGMSGKYVAFTASNIKDLGQGGVSNAGFAERTGSSGYNTTNFKDLLVFDASTGITKLVSHAGAGELTDFWSGTTTTLAADQAMNTGTRATDVQYAGMAGKYLFFTAANATFFGSGGAANTKFTDNNTAATDLFAYNMDNGTTQLLSHAAGDVNKGGNNSVAFAGSDGTYAYYTAANVAGFGNATAWTDTQTTKPDLVAVLLA